MRNVAVITWANVNRIRRDNLQVTIRHFKPSDLRAVMQIEAAAFPVDGYPESQFRDLHKEHPDGFVVAQLIEEVVGYAIGYMTDGKAEIDSIAVDLRYWNLGIGETLVKHQIAQFRRQGAAKCTLEVRTSNVRAIKFYEYLGFRIVRTAENYYADKGDAYVLEMEISPRKLPQEAANSLSPPLSKRTTMS